MLLANSDEDIEVSEEMSHDCGKRSAVIGSPHAGLAVNADRDGDSHVFCHSGVPDSGGSGLMIPLCAAAS